MLQLSNRSNARIYTLHSSNFATSDTWASKREPQKFISSRFNSIDDCKCIIKNKKVRKKSVIKTVTEQKISKKLQLPEQTIAFLTKNKSRGLLSEFYDI